MSAPHHASHLPWGQERCTLPTYGYEPNTFGLVQTVTGPAHTVTNTYEANRNVLTSKNNHVNLVNPVSKFIYQTNTIGQRTNLTTSGTAFSTAPIYNWSYNARGELVEANDTSTANNDRAYQFDAIGNRQKSGNGLIGDLPSTANYTVNALNQYTAIGSATPSYDLDGNATAYPMPNDQSANAQFIWNAENRLIEVKDSTGSSIATYQYDYLGRRISKTVGTVTTRWIYDGWNIITEYTGTTLTKSYTWGMDLSGSMQGAGGVGGLLAVEEVSNLSTYYPTFDGNGNVSEYMDSAGVVQAHYEYDAFGNEVTSVANKGIKHDDFSHRFSTKPLDVETGLYYYGYRYYDPVTGRWPSRDPIEEWGGFNLYGMVLNDPINWLDLLGLEICPAGTKKENKEIEKALEKIKKSGSEEAKKVVDELSKKDGRRVMIMPTSGSSKHTSRGPKAIVPGGNIRWNPKGDGGFSPESVLLHELVHALQDKEGRRNRDKDDNKNGYPDVEDEGVDTANDYRENVDEDQRDDYGDHNSDPEKRENSEHDDKCKCKESK